MFDRPRGLMDKASDFESEDCGFESHRGRVFRVSRVEFVTLSSASNVKELDRWRSRKDLPRPGIEPGTFRSSVWRSPNWAIAAIFCTGQKRGGICFVVGYIGCCSDGRELFKTKTFYRTSCCMTCICRKMAVGLALGSIMSAPGQFGFACLWSCLWIR